MPKHPRIAILTILAIAGMLNTPVAIAESGTYFKSEFAVGRAYDSNVFVTATDRQSDSFWRLSPSLNTGYDSTDMTLAFYGTFDAERYAQHTNLDGNVVRRYGAFAFLYRPLPRVGVNLHTDYTSTDTPQQLTPVTGLDLGRVHARVLSVNPTMTYGFSEVTNGELGYLHTKSLLDGGPDTEVDTSVASIERRASERSTFKLSLESTRYSFGSVDTVNSQLLIVGWNYKVAPRIQFSLAAGPRNTEGDVVPEFTLGLRQSLEEGEISLGYVRSQTAIIGNTSVVDARTLNASITYSPTRELRLQVTPSYVTERSGGGTASLYRINIGVGYEFNDSVSMLGSYQYNLQKGLLGAGSDKEVLDNIVYLGLVFTFSSEKSHAFEMPRNSPYEPLSLSQRDSFQATNTSLGK